MINVSDFVSLCKYNGLNFEKLSSDKKELCSIRVNSQHRIEFTVTEIQVDIVTTICNIIELSNPNHYK